MTNEDAIFEAWALLDQLDDMIDQHLCEIEASDCYELAEEMRSAIEPLIDAIRTQLVAA